MLAARTQSFDGKEHNTLDVLYSIRDFLRKRAGRLPLKNKDITPGEMAVVFRLCYMVHNGTTSDPQKVQQRIGRWLADYGAYLRGEELPYYVMRLHHSLTVTGERILLDRGAVRKHLNWARDQTVAPFEAAPSPYQLARSS